MANKNFGKLIKKLRTNSKLTMEELAKKVGVKKSTVSMWENSNVVPRDDILIKLSKIFNVSIDYLLGNEKRETLPNTKLEYIQRNLEKLDEKKLEQAENVLKALAMGGVPVYQYGSPEPVSGSEVVSRTFTLSSGESWIFLIWNRETFKGGKMYLCNGIPIYGKAAVIHCRNGNRTLYRLRN